jgi:hypothetical protein
MKKQNRHSGGGRNPVNNIFREADKTGMLSRYAGNYLIGWIPASAGMTRVEVMA